MRRRAPQEALTQGREARPPAAFEHAQRRAQKTPPLLYDSPGVAVGHPAAGSRDPYRAALLDGLQQLEEHGIDVLGIVPSEPPADIEL